MIKNGLFFLFGWCVCVVFVISCNLMSNDYTDGCCSRVFIWPFEIGIKYDIKDGILRKEYFFLKYRIIDYVMLFPNSEYELEGFPSKWK